MHWEGRGFAAPFLPARFPPRSPNCPPGRPRARVILALRARPSLPHERRSLFRLPRSSPLLARRGSRAKPTPGAAAGIAAEVVVTVDRHREQELAQPWLSSARWRGRRRGRRCVTGENAMQCEESWLWRRRVKGIDAMSFEATRLRGGLGHAHCRLSSLHDCLRILCVQIKVTLHCEPCSF